MSTEIDSLSIDAGWSWEPFEHFAFYSASLLTDPICRAHESFRRIYTARDLNPQDCAIALLAKQVFQGIEALGWAALALFASPPGALLRWIASSLQKNPFISMDTKTSGKELPVSRSFTLLSWNICCVGGGYTISDGGVVPWRERIDLIAERIAQADADVNCLYETFDTESGFLLAEKLKAQGYKHIYFNMGAKAIGVSSGMFVASKFEVENPEFVAFPQEALIGRTKNAAKGVFLFDLKSHGHCFARVFTTHLQHSEEPAFPTEEEISARKMEMEIIVDKIQKTAKDRCIVLTGDLNLDDQEYASSSWQSLFTKGVEYTEKTWKGDEWCAKLMGKKISGPLNLDHTMVLNGTARSIQTQLHPTGYDPKELNPNAPSDHEELFSVITV